MRCHHTWHALKTEPLTDTNGLRTTRYTHECPQCGKVKVTVRADRALPPEVKWKREMEKLLTRAAEEGYAYSYVGSGIFRLAIEAISVAKTD